MTRYVVVPALVLSLVFSTAFAATEIVFPDAPAQLLPGDRVLLGTVEEIAGEQAPIDTGEVQSRYIPMNVRKAKELSELKRGDRVEITVNDQNLLVDVHTVGESSHHLVVQGKIIEPLATGHQKAVIRNSCSGKEEWHFIHRSRLAVGSETVFLIDELNKIADVTFWKSGGHPSGGRALAKTDTTEGSQGELAK